jgi:hypothetical protein
MRFFSTDVPMLIGRQFGDEVVLANYETGLYYSIADTAAKIWHGLKAGVPAEEIASEFAIRHASDAQAVEASVSGFIEQLAAEGIIVPIDGTIERREWQLAAADEFQPPVLERYDDLRDLLLLDPVHDVDNAGWPARADDAS